ncbi:DUF4870 domain-containing protein [Dehalogenimonas sp. THU2]|uniref:DUF4870 domain-containing protein n=1 Tax=Dehalogenimonas sp. THU2 TaxID=3151121 RepID=UPI003218CF6B
MSLTPEERMRIYQEEKARIEAQENVQQERFESDSKSKPPGGLSPNVAGLLSYAGGWVSGLIFLALEKENRFVRFHAAQSIIVFGILNIISMSLGWIPGAGGVISGLVLAFSLVFWIVLMVKAYQGVTYKLPMIGDIAESLARNNQHEKQQVENEIPQFSQPGSTVATVSKDLGESVKQQSRSKAGRMIASAFAIAWSIVWLIVFNFFHQYLAFYNGETVGGVTIWKRYPVFTEEISLWLPILTLTLMLTIVVHIILIIIDKYLLRELSTICLNIFSLITVLVLLAIFPFDFSAIPDTTAADITQTSVTIALILIVTAITIGVLVKFIKLVMRLASGKASYSSR